MRNRPMQPATTARTPSWAFTVRVSGTGDGPPKPLVDAICAAIATQKARFPCTVTTESRAIRAARPATTEVSDG